MTKTYTFNDIEGLQKTLRKVSKEASVELRTSSVRIASKVADEASREAYQERGVAALVAPTIRATRDRVPKILMGGTKQIKRSRVSQTHRTLKVNVDAGALNLKNQTVGNVMWGAEFGSRRYRQFSPWRGSGAGAGYFLWPNIRANDDYIEDEYGDALIRAVDKSAKGSR